MGIISAPFPTLPAADLGRARKFYESVLNFRPGDRAMPGGVLYDVGIGHVWVYESPNAGTAANTAAAWFVDDLDAEVERLRGAGVEFQTFEMPGMEWDGVIALQDGFRSAWFTDTEGNVLCLDERR